MDYNSSLNMSENMDMNSTTENVTATIPVRRNNNTYFMVAFVLSWINVVLIVGLNIGVIVTILRYKKRSRLYFLLLNLAIADLMTGLVDVLPQSIERSIGMSYTVMLWPFGDALCKIQRTAANMAMTASNYILAATSLDRAMVICKPMVSFKRGHILQKCIIVACWTFSFLVSTPYLKLMTAKPSVAGDGWYHCSVDWGGADPINSWKVFIIVIFGYIFVIPFIIIVVSYAILLCSLHKRAVNTSKRLNNQAPLTATRVFNQRLPKTKMKSIKLTFGIILGFIVSWMVFFVVMFLSIYANVRHPVIMVVVTFYFWSSISNPIMFFIYHRRNPRRSTPTSMYSSDGGRSTYSSEMRISAKHHVTEK